MIFFPNILSIFFKILKNIIKDNMENALLLSVPLKVEVGQGPNWLEAH